MTLEQLRIFLAVAEREHLTQAADALHLTPSAVSSSIRALEAQHQAALFDRVGRGIQLTAAGRLFADEARAVLDRAAAAEAVLADLGSLTSGTLLVGASQTTASYHLPRILMSYRDAHPAVAIRLVTGNTDTVAHAVIDGRVELGFIEGPFQSDMIEPRAIGEDELVVLVGPAHPWARQRGLGARHLAEARWVMREEGSGTRATFEAHLQSLGIGLDSLRVALELPSNEAVLSAIESGSCAAAISTAAAAPAIAAGRVVRADLMLTRRRLTMIRHRSRHATRAGLAFEAMVFGAEGWRAVSPTLPPPPRSRPGIPAA